MSFMHCSGAGNRISLNPMNPTACISGVLLTQDNTLKNRLMQFLAGQFERFMFMPIPACGGDCRAPDKAGTYSA